MTDRDALLEDPRIGRLLNGKYRLVRVLGRGGMGAVFEARHEVIGRRFALKFLHPELAASPEILRRFRREAQAAGSLESENIAAVTDFGEAEDGSSYIVMEFLQGEDLRRLLEAEGPLPAPRAAELVIQACRGLEAAHSHGIVHRDLKPENLFVLRRRDGSDLVKVLDFGIAKLRTEGDTGAQTRTGATIGTPYYMPPEQAKGQKDVDYRADIYALGVILYELLSGQRPYTGDSYNAILFHILTKTPTPLEQLRPSLPAGLAEVVRRAMAYDANDRFQQLGALVDALLPFTEESPPGKRRMLSSAQPFDFGKQAIPLAAPEEVHGPAAGTMSPASKTSDGRQATRTKYPFPLVLGLAAMTMAVAGALFIARRTAAPSLDQASSAAARPSAETEGVPLTPLPSARPEPPAMTEPPPSVARPPALVVTPAPSATLSAGTATAKMPEAARSATVATTAPRANRKGKTEVPAAAKEPRPHRPAEEPAQKPNQDPYAP